MFEATGRVMYRRRRWVVAIAVAFLTFAGTWGTGVFAGLTSGGFEDKGSDSFRAGAVAADRLGRDDADVIVLYRSATATVDDPAYRRAVTSTLDRLPRDTVDRVTTYWATRAPQLVSADRHATYAVLRLVAQGLTDAQVAEKLVLSPRTVSTHLTSIYGKLQVESRTKAIARARELNIV